MNGYTKYRYFDSDVHVYEFNQRKETLAHTIGVKRKLERLSCLGVPPMGKVITAKMNSTFFDPPSKTDLLGDDMPGWTQVVYGKDTVIRLYSPKSIGDISEYEKDCFWSVPASYTLLEEGRISIKNTGFFPHYLQRHPRSILGQRKNLNIMLIVVQGRKLLSKGMTAVQEAEMCKKLGLWTAVNCDGGGSSELIVNGKIMNKPTDGCERAIGGAFYVYK